MFYFFVTDTFETPTITMIECFSTEMSVLKLLKPLLLIL